MTMLRRTALALVATLTVAVAIALSLTEIPDADAATDLDLAAAPYAAHGPSTVGVRTLDLDPPVGRTWIWYPTSAPSGHTTYPYDITIAGTLGATGIGTLSGHAVTDAAPNMTLGARPLVVVEPGYGIGNHRLRLARRAPGLPRLHRGRRHARRIAGRCHERTVALRDHPPPTAASPPGRHHRLVTRTRPPGPHGRHRHRRRGRPLLRRLHRPGRRRRATRHRGVRAPVRHRVGDRPARRVPVRHARTAPDRHGRSGRPARSPRRPVARLERTDRGRRRVPGRRRLPLRRRGPGGAATFPSWRSAARPTPTPPTRGAPNRPSPTPGLHTGHGPHSTAPVTWCSPPAAPPCAAS